MILGIDPGLENTGWGVIDEDGVVEMGVIVTTRSQSSPRS